MGMLVTESEQEIYDHYLSLREEFARAHNRGDGSYHPSLRLALELLNSSNTKTTVNDAHAEALLKVLTKDSRLARVKFLSNYVGDSNVKNNERLYAIGVKRAISDGKGGVIPLQEAGKQLHKSNVVLTGHPVYGDTPEQDNAVAKAVAFETGADGYGPETLERLFEVSEQPFKTPTLEDVGNGIFHSLENVHFARKTMQFVAMDTIRANYPDKKWTEIDYNPNIPSIWHTIDWDGRTDIKWYQAMRTMYRLQKFMMDQYIPQMDALAKMLKDDERQAVLELTDKFKFTREIAARQEKFFAQFYPGNEPTPDQLKEYVREMVNTRPQRAMDSHEAAALMQKIIDNKDDIDILKISVGLRSDYEGLGYLGARPNVRVNSTAARKGASARYGINIEDAPNQSIDERFSGRLEQMIQTMVPTNPNILTIANSKADVYTLSGIMREVKDEIDCRAQFHELYADAHNATDVQCGQLIGQELGMTGHITHMPLIEDARGSDKAIKIMAGLYNKQSFMDNAVKTGVVAMQLGYSDYGVTAGQYAAGGFHDDTIREFIKYHATSPLGKAGVKLMIFHTGGNNPGRGNHPGGIEERQAAYISPDNLRLAKELGVELINETSYQGGYGQTGLATREGCLAEMVKVSNYLMTGHLNPPDDAYYNSNYRPKEMYATARNAHEKLMGRPKDEIETSLKRAARIFESLAPRSGDRPVNAEGTEIKKLRAIRYGTTEEQLAFLIILLSGVLEAIENDPQAFKGLTEESSTHRRHLAFVIYGLNRSFPGIHGSYFKLFDPELYADRADHLTGDASVDFDRTAKDLRDFGIFRDLKDVPGILKKIHKDLTKFVNENNLMDFPEFKNPNFHVEPEQVAKRELNHAIRMASMMEFFMHASKMEISSRHDITEREVKKDLMMLRFDRLTTLTKMFEEVKIDDDDIPEKPSTCVPFAGYKKLNEEDLHPMQKCIDRMRRVSLINSNFDNTIG